jgi:hypothetical protein
MKCPSCGFDSPEGASWCDFCKHPFKREKSAPARAPSAPSSEPRIKKLIEDLPDEVRAKLPAHLEAAAAEEEQVRGVSREVRLMAWAFFGFWFLLFMIAAGMLLGRRKLISQEAREPAPSAQALPAPGP